MLIRSSENHYSTVDMSVINLYTGMCDFVKLGASTTFVKWTRRRNSTIKFFANWNGKPTRL